MGLKFKDGYIDVGKYMIAYEEKEAGHKLPHYILCNKDLSIIHLGKIRWYGRWKKFVWDTDELESDIIFDDKCLEDIMKFIKLLNDLHKEGYYERNKN